MRFRRTASAMSISAVVGLAVAASGASAAIVPTRTASELAAAMSSQQSLVTGASFVTIPPIGTPSAVSTTRRVGFPRNANSYAILSTGNTPNLFGSPGLNLSSDLTGPNVNGDTDFDVSVLKVDLAVPVGRNCLSLDTRFMSEEFPEFPGVTFNDAFLMELDINDWTTIGSRVIAPHNFAIRSNTPGSNGEPLNIRTTGDTSANRANAIGTRFDGGTPLLRITTPIKPGAHSLYLSLFDQGDHIYDSAVFLDRLRAFTTKNPCPIGAFPAVKPSVRALHTTTRAGIRRYRAHISSESGLGRISVRLDGRTVYSRAPIPIGLRHLHLAIPVHFGALRKGVHRLVYKVSNRAGTTTLVQTIRR